MKKLIKNIKNTGFIENIIINEEMEENLNEIKIEENKNEEKIITFRILLERNVNLLTILGIFNALALYSTSIKQQSISLPLSCIFTILSIAILSSIIFDIPQYKHKILKFELFQMALILCQFLLVSYLIVNYLEMMLPIIYLGIAFLLTYWASYIVSKFYFSKLKATSNSKFKLYKFLFYLTVFILFIVMLYIAGFITKGIEHFFEFLFINNFK